MYPLPDMICMYPPPHMICMIAVPITGPTGPHYGKSGEKKWNPFSQATGAGIVPIAQLFARGGETEEDLFVIGPFSQATGDGKVPITNRYK